MTLLSGALIWTFHRGLGKRRGAVAAALGIALYTLLVGASPAIMRAAILSGLTLLAASSAAGRMPSTAWPSPAR